MRCPYCAEQIQDAAILCRFCGARKESGAWQPPAAPRLEQAPASAPPPGPKEGAFTIKTSAVLLLVSAVLELASIADPVPLFGAMRGGIVAVLHHGLYLAGFLVAGLGLWKATRWGFKSVFALTGWYTLDKLLYLVDSHARDAELSTALSSDLVRQVTGMTGHGNLVEDLRSQIFQMYTITTLVVLACWWGFALYIYLRRSYFDAR